MKKNMKKKMDEERDEEATEGEGEDEEKSYSKKSEDLTEDDLQKSLDQLDALVESQDSISRKQALLEKAQNGELEKSERDELFALMGGAGESEAIEDESGLEEEVLKGMDESEPIQKALDVSDYITEHHNELRKSLGTMAKAIEAEGQRRQEFDLLAAQAISRIGKLVKSLDARMENLESQPARKPKSKGITQPLNKSMGDTPAVEGMELSKGQVMDAMEEIMRKSVDSGSKGMLENGVDMNVAITQYEAFNTMQPAVLQVVKEHIQNKKGAAVH